MCHGQWALPVIAVTVLFANEARANLIYTYSGSGGSTTVSGSFTVADTAIQDGFITPSEIEALGFMTTGPALAFPLPSNAIFGTLPVNRTTGQFEPIGSLMLHNQSTSPVSLLNIVTGPSPTQFFLTLGMSMPMGTGSWELTNTTAAPPIPGPSTLSLLLAAGVISLGYKLAKRTFLSIRVLLPRSLVAG